MKTDWYEKEKGPDVRQNGDLFISGKASFTVIGGFIMKLSTNLDVTQRNCYYTGDVAFGITASCSPGRLSLPFWFPLT